MQKVFCDRCGQECEGTIHYNVRIYGRNNNPSIADNICSSETSSQNLQVHIIDVFNPERQYCEKCKNEFEEFLKNKPKAVLPKNDIAKKRKSFFGII